jgi:hypothetical protein
MKFCDSTNEGECKVHTASLRIAGERSFGADKKCFFSSKMHFDIQKEWLEVFGCANFNTSDCSFTFSMDKPTDDVFSASNHY